MCRTEVKKHDTGRLYTLTLPNNISGLVLDIYRCMLYILSDGPVFGGHLNETCFDNVQSRVSLAKPYVQAGNINEYSCV